MTTMNFDGLTNLHYRPLAARNYQSTTKTTPSHPRTHGKENRHPHHQQQFYDSGCQLDGSSIGDSSYRQTVDLPSSSLSLSKVHEKSSSSDWSTIGDQKVAFSIDSLLHSSSSSDLASTSLSHPKSPSTLRRITTTSANPSNKEILVANPLSNIDQSAFGNLFSTFSYYYNLYCSTLSRLAPTILPSGQAKLCSTDALIVISSNANCQRKSISPIVSIATVARGLGNSGLDRMSSSWKESRCSSVVPHSLSLSTNNHNSAVDCLSNKINISKSKTVTSSILTTPSISNKQITTSGCNDLNDYNNLDDVDHHDNVPSSVNGEDCSSLSGRLPIIYYSPEPPGTLKKIRQMLANNDPLLEYINDGAAIRNPFAVNRKEQLSQLMKLLCKRLDNGHYQCSACQRVTRRLRPMQQHLLSHSNSKFNLCIKCLKGFNDKYDMKRHTRKHTLVRPYQCSICQRAFSQRCSLEGHQAKIHHIKHAFSRNQRREVVRVCEQCGYSCQTAGDLLKHASMCHHYDSNRPLFKRLSELNDTHRNQVHRSIRQHQQHQSNLSINSGIPSTNNITVGQINVHSVNSAFCPYKFDPPSKPSVESNQLNPRQSISTANYNDPYCDALPTNFTAYRDNTNAFGSLSVAANTSKLKLIDPQSKGLRH